MVQSSENSSDRPRPLAGLKVVDFSTLLPGPLAALILAEAGADVIKIERPGTGDEMRSYEPKLGGNDSANFILLNRGKKSRALDLKVPADNAAARELVADADILIEQFRPGVMARLGLSYEELSKLNPGLIYCSITGYGQDGVRAALASHDLNYVADAGMLSLVVDKDGTPSIPAMPLADIGGGTLPAVINILLALQERSQTGRGRHLDIAMTENVFSFIYWAMGKTLAGEKPTPSGELVTGASPRYCIYRTRDGRHIAAAPLEDKFWHNFCSILGIQIDATKEQVAAVMATRDAEDWMADFRKTDVCCSIVRDIEEALADTAFAERGLFHNQVLTPRGAAPALPLPLIKAYRSGVVEDTAPMLGEE